MVHRRLKSWNKFLTRHFAVPPDVVGNQHTFPFENASILLKLPTSDQIDRDNGSDDVASISSRRATDNEPLEIAVHKVDVEVTADFTFPIPSDALTRNPNAFDLFSEDQQNQLESSTNQHQKRAEGAFHYWVRVMRWVCDDYRIAREEVSGSSSGWGTYLLDEETGHRVWAQSLMFTFPGCRCVNETEWNAAQQKLADGMQPPVYMELKHGAQAQLELGDCRRALLDAAVACETYLRTIVIRHLPDSLNSRLVDYIEEGNIFQFINKFVPGFLDEAGNRQFKRLKSDLSSLFDRRNKLMHLGSTQDLNRDVCQRFIDVTEKLLAIEVRV